MMAFGSFGVEPAANPRPRVWAWILGAMLAVALLGGGMLFRWVMRGVKEAQQVSAQELAIVQAIASEWSVETLFAAAGGELRQRTPESVARADFDEWRTKLGTLSNLSVDDYQVLAVKGTRGNSTIVTAQYAGVFQRGTANIDVQFKQTGDGWPILSFSVSNIVSTAGATTGTSGAALRGVPATSTSSP